MTYIRITTEATVDHKAAHDPRTPSQRVSVLTREGALRVMHALETAGARQESMAEADAYIVVAAMLRVALDAPA